MNPASADEIRTLVEQLDKGRQAWISGHLEKEGTDHMVQAEGMTIFGPFGGGIVSAGVDFERLQALVAAQFKVELAVASSSIRWPQATFSCSS